MATAHPTSAPRHRPPPTSGHTPPPAPALAGARRGPTPRSRRSPAQLRAVLAERLPELLATAGVALLVAAVAGFVVSQWSALDNLGQAGLLVAGSAVLTAQGTWASRRDGRFVHRMVPLSWGAAAGLTLVASQLLLEVGLPDHTRLAIAGAGLVAASHAGWAWHRRPDSVVLQVVTVAAATWAVGPVGRSVADGWGGTADLAWAGIPIAAIFGLDGSTTDGFLVVAIGHLLVAVAWIAVGLRLPDVTASRVARVGGALLLAWSALEFNAMASPIGASLALVLVLGFLVVGMALEDALLIAFGAMAGLVTGLRTTWSLFSGETAVTLTVAITGVVLVLTAMRLGRARDDESGAPEQSAPEQSAPEQSAPEEFAPEESPDRGRDQPGLTTGSPDATLRA